MERSAEGVAQRARLGLVGVFWRSRISELSEWLSGMIIVCRFQMS